MFPTTDPCSQSICGLLNVFKQFGGVNCRQREYEVNREFGVRQLFEFGGVKRDTFNWAASLTQYSHISSVRITDRHMYVVHPFSSHVHLHYSKFFGNNANREQCKPRHKAIFKYASSFRK